MRFALMTEPQQGLSYDEILALARTAEDAGLEAFFRSDHYTSFPGEAGMPTTDAWATLAGLARDTTRIRLGTLVSPVTFRIPGSLAKVVATADEMSDGRIELGMGAGWNEQEHEQLGIPFPTLLERYDMLEEALAVMHGLWAEPVGGGDQGARPRRAGAHRRQRRRQHVAGRASRPLDHGHPGRGLGARSCPGGSRSAAHHAPGLPAAGPRDGAPDGRDIQFGLGRSVGPFANARGRDAAHRLCL